MYPHMYTTDTQFYNSSLNIGSILSHNLFGCNTIGINSSFNSCLTLIWVSVCVCVCVCVGGGGGGEDVGERRGNFSPAVDFSLITHKHVLIPIAFRNKFYCGSINSFITHFLSHKAVSDIL